MQRKLDVRRVRMWKPLAVALTCLASAIVFRKSLLQVTILISGGSALAFLLKPLAKGLETCMSRPLATLTALGLMAAAVIGLLGLFLPLMVREAAGLMDALPQSAAALAEWSKSASDALARHLPGVTLPAIPMDGLTGLMSSLGSGMLSLAGSAASAVSRLSLMTVLCYFFLCDRDSLLLRLELLVPRSARCTVVRMGAAVARELRLYIQGQLLVAAAVGLLTSLGLTLIGVRSSLMLGGIVGILNMVPYFGPFIGALPAVLIALGDGWERALMCLGVLVLVQQLDSAVISPRIMGSLTGFSPAAVLIAIYAGASFAGISGMLLALPVMMSVRTLFRVFVQQRENN